MKLKCLIFTNTYMLGQYYLTLIFCITCVDSSVMINGALKDLLFIVFLNALI